MKEGQNARRDAKRHLADITRWPGRPAPLIPGTTHDRIDEMIERWGASTLITFGIAAILVGAAGYFRWLPAPFAAPTFSESCIGCRQLTPISQIVLYSGVILMIVGMRIRGYFYGVAAARRRE